MMVQEDEDRVLWVDFDRAQTLTPDSLQQYQVEWLEEEADMMDYFVKALVLSPTALMTAELLMLICLDG